MWAARPPQPWHNLAESTASGTTPGGSLGNGTYSLSGGLLAVTNTSDGECIGDSGTGTFTQSGGTNTVSSLTLGFYSGDKGTYNLTAVC